MRSVLKLVRAELGAVAEDESTRLRIGSQLMALGSGQYHGICSRQQLQASILGGLRDASSHQAHVNYGPARLLNLAMCRSTISRNIRQAWQLSRLLLSFSTGQARPSKQQVRKLLNDHLQ